MIKIYLKKIIKKLLGENTISNFIKLYFLIQNYWVAFKLYYIHSTIFKVDSLEKIECTIILDYH